jgi:transcription termination factor Rho
MTDSAQPDTATPVNQAAPAAPRRRGRPPKVKPADAALAAKPEAPVVVEVPVLRQAPIIAAPVESPAAEAPSAPTTETADNDTTAERNDSEANGESAAPAANGDNLLRVPAGKRVVIGITGEPGAGKSSLTRQFHALGARVMNVDEEGHRLLDQPAVRKALVQQFGDDVLNGDGEINRRALAAKAFATPEATAALNAIMHPRINDAVRAHLPRLGNFVVIDAALLHEIGLADLCTLCVYVKANREVRVTRVADRNWDEAELARREAALGDADVRRKRCPIAVDNSGDPALLTAYAKTLLARQLGVDPGKLRRTPQAPVQDTASGDEADTTTNEATPAPARPERNERFERRFERRDGQQPGQQNGQQGQPQNPRFPGQQNGQPQNAQPGQQNPQQSQRPPQPAPVPERPPVKVNLDDYLKRKLPDLQGEADKLEVRDVKWLKKHDLICEILRRVAGGRQDEILVEGYMEIVKDQGYIRSPLNQYLAVSTDTFVANPQIRRYGLKPGMHVTGVARAPRGNERCPQLLSINTVMGEPENARTPVQDFEHLIPLHAHDRLFMELPNDPTDYSLRIIDMIAPIGKGQRGLIVAQPKCGKTVYLQKIAKAITTNNPECVLMVLLVDERPEEVTDMQRSVNGEVIASTFDQQASRHVQCAEMTINKAKRLVEQGKDVVILLDSITRLARAYNTESPGSGRVMSGGIESGALIKPKQFFGAARKIEDGGSLTILATALVDTGSLADTVIFEEFKGTGNMELVLDRRLADRRCFPALNVAGSGTRKDDLLIKNEDELRRTWALRKFLADRSPQDAVEFLRSKLKNHKTNISFLLTVDPDKMSAW